MKRAEATKTIAANQEMAEASAVGANAGAANRFENAPENGESEAVVLSADQRFGASLSSLIHHANELEDWEKIRISLNNQIKALERKGSSILADIGGLREQLEFIEQREAETSKALEKDMKIHPLADHVKSVKGLGLKTVARWLGRVQDPAWHPVHNRPRRLGELFAFCGLAVVDGKAQRATRGQKSNWSALARVRAYNMAEACIKQVGDDNGKLPSPFRLVYDARREHTKTTHPDWPDWHSHKDAIRVTMKAIVKDLWLASRALGNHG